jgi:hypothetical protein
MLPIGPLSSPLCSYVYFDRANSLHHVRVYTPLRSLPPSSLPRKAKMTCA